MSMAEKIKEIPIFSKLSPANIRALEKIAIFKNYEAGEIVFYEGDKPGTLYVLTEGVLRLYKTDPKGNEIFIHQFVPTGLIGELACFENMPYPATSRFITNGQILKIDYKRLEKDFFQNPDISMAIIKSLTQKVKILSGVLHKEMILTSEAKVAKLIVETPELFKQYKNTQIASILNITPETLSRTLTKFRKSEYITIEKNHAVVVLDEVMIRSLYE